MNKSRYQLLEKIEPLNVALSPSGAIWVLRGEGISKDENVTINGQKVLSDSEGNLMSSEYILNVPEYA